MFKALRKAGLVVNKKRVVRLMRLHGMARRFRRRKCRTTFPSPDGYHIPDLVGRGFTPGEPDVAWCQDITYIPTREGWLYLASVLDLGSRPAAGVLDGRSHAHRARARRARHGHRRPRRRRARRRGHLPRRPGIAVHRERLRRLLPGPHDAPLGRTDRSVLGNAVAESFWESLKRECLQGRVFANRVEARRSIFRWINWVQHRQASQHPQARPAHRVGTAVPASVITDPSARRGDAQFQVGTDSAEVSRGGASRRPWAARAPSPLLRPPRPGRSHPGEPDSGQALGSRPSGRSCTDASLGAGSP